MRRINRYLVCLLLGILVSGCAQPRELIRPQFQVNPKGPKVAESVIRTALANRGWLITKQVPGRFEALHRKGGSITATVAVIYSGNSVKIDYLDSANLKYGRNTAGKEVIHGAYNNWVTYLEQDISIGMAAAG